MKHCGKMPDAKEELNRTVRVGRKESRHSIKSLEWMGSRSRGLGAELIMHSFTIDYDACSNDENVVVVVSVPSARYHVLKQCLL